MSAVSSYHCNYPRPQNDLLQNNRSCLKNYNTQVSKESQSFSSIEETENGFQAFQVSLTSQYQSFSTQKVVPVSKLENPKLSPDVVANNILGFIEQRLRKDAAEGASEEELAERLNQGLEGFKKGFAEAKEKIEALGMLNPTVEESINETYDLVVAGVDDLRARFVDGEQADTEIEGAKGTTNAPSSELSASFGQVSYAKLNSLRFEVETADGDVITINAKAKDVYLAEYRGGSFATANNSGMFEDFANQSFQSSDYNMDVDGELDEDELVAINDLIAKVENLSQTFFDGNLEDAFNQALNLGYNTEELVGYSLNLRQVEVQRVSVAYQQIVPDQITPINPVADKLQPLGDFAQGLLDAMKLASPFAEPTRLISDLSEQFEIYRPQKVADDSETTANPFSDFVKRILESLPSVDTKMRNKLIH